ncbi:hypothetical protein F5X98DRAFT_120650 [Xylaria grammica]|nr:hypothetical protein F5X98DRAFT_120650 [Xylaria grammica]
MIRVHYIYAFSLFLFSFSSITVRFFFLKKKQKKHVSLCPSVTGDAVIVLRFLRPSCAGRLNRLVTAHDKILLAAQSLKCLQYMWKTA